MNIRAFVRKKSIITCTAAFFATLNAVQAEQVVTLGDVISHVLIHNLEIEKQKTQIEQSDAATQQINGAFDWRLMGKGGYRRPRVPATNEQGLLTSETKTNDVYSVTIGMEKRFRSGISVAPGVSYSKNMDNNSSAALAQSVSLGHVAINIPLLRGRGNSVTTANERAAKKMHQASKLNKDRMMAKALVQASSQYWQSIAAKKNLAAKRRAGKEATAIAENLKKLSEQGELSILEYQSHVADLNLRRLKIEKSVVTWNSTRRKLARLIQSGHRINSLPVPEGNFPEIDIESALSLDHSALTDIAFEQRRDLLALHQNIKSKHLGLLKARNDLWPQLDLNIDLDKVNLSYSQSLGNNLGKGRRRAAAAKLKANEIEVEILKRSISDEVYESMTDLQHSLATYQQAHEAHKLFGQIADTTRDKVSQGTAARNEYLSALDKLSEVEHIINSARVNYVSALAKLRLATGTLPVDSQNIRNTLNTLLSVPTNG